MTRLISTPGPHLKAEETVSRAMLDVVLALVPVSAMAVYFFGLYALFTIGVCLITAVITELVFRKAMGKAPSIKDCSAILTGLLVALCFPATVVWWKAALATFVAVGIVKELMGGLGWNLFNPALLGRVSVILLPSLFGWLNVQLDGLQPHLGTVDITTQATPLALLHTGEVPFSLGQLIVGFEGGAMGEVSPLLLLIGAAYLLYKKHIDWRIPVSIIATVFVLSLLVGANPLHYVLIGGIFLGAFFMATDWVTSPMTDKGKLIFGVAIGVLIVVFRSIGPVEGVAFSILIMNAFVPLINKWTRRPSFSDPRPAPASAGKEVSG